LWIATLRGFGAEMQLATVQAEALEHFEIQQKKPANELVCKPSLGSSLERPPKGGHVPLCPWETYMTLLLAVLRNARPSTFSVEKWSGWSYDAEENRRSGHG